MVLMRMKAGRKEWTEAGSLAEMTQNNSLPTEERKNGKICDGQAPIGSSRKQTVMDGTGWCVGGYVLLTEGAERMREFRNSSRWITDRQLTDRNE